MLGRVIRRLETTVSPLSVSLDALTVPELYSVQNQPRLCAALKSATISLRKQPPLDLSSHPSLHLISTHASSYSPFTLSHCLQFLSQANIRSPSLWTSLLPLTTQAISQLPPFSVAEVVISYGKSGIKDRKLWEDFEKVVVEVVARAKVLTVPQLVALWNAFSACPVGITPSLLRALESDVEKNAGIIDFKRFPLIATAYFKENTQNSGLMTALDRRMNEICHYFDANSLYFLLFYRLMRGNKENGSILKLENAILRQFQAISGEKMVKLMVQYAVYAKDYKPSRRFVTSWSEMMGLNYLKLLSPLENVLILDLMWSWSVLRLENRDLLQKVLEDLRHREVPWAETHLEKIRKAREYYEELGM